MPQRLAIAALPILALLTACGGQDVTVTNDSNVILNDAYANTAFLNDGAGGNEMIMVDPQDTGANSVTSAGDAMMGNTPDAANAATANIAN